MKLLQTDDEELGQIARFENILMEGDMVSFVKYWTEDVKKAIRTYCERRYAETQNNHLKTKYGWGLWTIGEKSNFQLLSKTVDQILEILETDRKSVV